MYILVPKYLIYTHLGPFRPKHESTPVISPEKKEQKTSTFQKVLQNIRIQINGLHIRFEDDYFNSENPFAFGILCDVIFLPLIICRGFNGCQWIMNGYSSLWNYPSSIEEKIRK